MAKKIIITKKVLFFLMLLIGVLILSVFSYAILHNQASNKISNKEIDCEILTRIEYETTPSGYEDCFK